MARAFVRVLPLALGAAVNARVLAVQVVLLDRSARPLFLAGMFGAGAVAPLVVIGAIALIAVHVATAVMSDTQAVLASAVVDLIIGGMLLLAAVVVRQGRPSAPERHADLAASQPDMMRTFLRGAAVMATDLSTVAMFVTATKDLAAGGLVVLAEAFLFLLVLAITTLTAWAPPVLYRIDPSLVRRVLTPVGAFLHRHGRSLGEALLAAIGVYLVIRGALATG